MAAKSQVTIARLMATIAAFAVLFGVMRYQPVILVFAAPVAGALWGMRRGETGFRGGLIGGLTTFWVGGLALLFIRRYQSGPGVTSSMLTMENILVVTFSGVAIGILAFFVAHLLSQTIIAGAIIDIFGIPRDLRVRVEHAKPANPVGAQECASPSRVIRAGSSVAPPPKKPV